MKKYRKEKFKDRNEVIIWCADNKPMYYTNDEIETHSINWSLNQINDYWQTWHKAIEIKKKEPIKLCAYLHGYVVKYLTKEFKCISFDGGTYLNATIHVNKNFRKLPESKYPPIYLDPDTFEVIEQEGEDKESVDFFRTASSNLGGIGEAMRDVCEKLDKTIKQGESDE